MVNISIKLFFSSLLYLWKEEGEGGMLMFAGLLFLIE